MASVDPTEDSIQADLWNGHEPTVSRMLHLCPDSCIYILAKILAYGITKLTLVAAHLLFRAQHQHWMGERELYFCLKKIAVMTLCGRRDVESKYSYLIPENIERQLMLGSPFAEERSQPMPENMSQEQMMIRVFNCLEEESIRTMLDILLSEGKPCSRRSTQRIGSIDAFILVRPD